MNSQDIPLNKKSVYQQRWIAKRHLRGYHVPNISEKQFVNRHFENLLPMRKMSETDRLKCPPMQVLTFGELERRVDVVVFRSHFASSIWEARQLVTSGKVRVNGEKSPYASRRLEDGDMVTVDPKAVVTLRGKTEDHTKPRKFTPVPYMSPWMFIPSYLEVDYATCSTIFVRSPHAQPNRMEIPSPMGPTFHQLVYEWYSRIFRSKSKLKPKHPLTVANQYVKLKPKFESIVRMDQRNANRDARRHFDLIKQRRFQDMELAKNE